MALYYKSFLNTGSESVDAEERSSGPSVARRRGAATRCGHTRDARSLPAEASMDVKCVGFDGDEEGVGPLGVCVGGGTLS